MYLLLTKLIALLLLIEQKVMQNRTASDMEAAFK